MKITVLILLSLYLMSQGLAAAPPSILGNTICCGDNTVSVTGYGKVSVSPDIAKINVGASVTAETSQAATKGVAQKINAVLLILTSNGIKKNDIQTQYISIYPTYDYPDGVAVLSGQTATQTLSVTVRNIDKNGGNLGTLIDKLVKINGIQFNGLVFSKQNTADAQKQARKAAFINAKTKAGEYSDLSGKKLDKVLTIEDNNQFSSPVLYTDARAFSSKSIDSTSVPVGTVDISYTVQVKFALN